ncbi:hypothetical protein B0H16DRAFT_1881589 [Mycena metata]|uniref:Uncharacterized protein n=1 Tax=Mycena metata TaxID=1033252 RepID=A0AAD7NQD1_9AGAR|nr:hypothetical protein B0H16DRAFT_1881589 [Mycena metata]
MSRTLSIGLEGCSAFAAQSTQHCQVPGVAAFATNHQNDRKLSPPVWHFKSAGLYAGYLEQLSDYCKDILDPSTPESLFRFDGMYTSIADFPGRAEWTKMPQTNDVGRVWTSTAVSPQTLERDQDEVPARWAMFDSPQHTPDVLRKHLDSEWCLSDLPEKYPGINGQLLNPVMYHLVDFRSGVPVVLSDGTYYWYMSYDEHEDLYEL